MDPAVQQHPAKVIMVVPVLEVQEHHMVGVAEVAVVQVKPVELEMEILEVMAAPVSHHPFLEPLQIMQVVEVEVLTADCLLDLEAPAAAVLVTVRHQEQLEQ
jgi:hypothetical protein